MPKTNRAGKTNWLMMSQSKHNKQGSVERNEGPEEKEEKERKKKRKKNKRKRMRTGIGPEERLKQVRNEDEEWRKQGLLVKQLQIHRLALLQNTLCSSFVMPSTPHRYPLSVAVTH